ncbi:MAG: hypothetical protein KDB00_02340 [Planctomycetales bacterium]|nr:hypothetical protein [Planctomycetales bacterium]
MIVDIRKDVPDFLAYIRKRVAEQVAASKKLKRPKPVTRIDFGFEFGQGNELWLVFDTRPDAEPDGEWTLKLDKVKALKRPKWPIWEELPDGEVVFFIDLNGEKVNVMKSPDKKICKIVGEAMKHAMMEAREAGLFKRLPKAERCEMGVENMEGFYGWPKYKDRGKEDLV